MLNKNLLKGKLKNGIEVLIYEEKMLPIFSLIIGFKIGKYLEPSDKNGIFYLMGSTVDKGVEGKDVNYINEFFEKEGAKFNVSVSRTFFSLSLLCLTEKVEKLLNLFSKIVKCPDFPKNEVSKEKLRIISEMIQERAEPEIQAEKKFYELFYEGSIIGRPLEGDLNSIKNIDEKDIREFYQSYVVPSSGIIGVCSSMPKEKVFDVLNKYFGDWNKKGKKIEVKGEITNKKKIKVIRMNVNQVFVRIGHEGIKRKDKDFEKVVLLNYILGGGSFASRLFKKIRKEKGYAYSVYTRLSILDPFKGPFIYAFQTGRDNFISAMTLLLEEVEKFRKKGPSLKEVEEAKGFYRGSLAREIETYIQKTGILINSLRYELEPFYFRKSLKKIMNLKKEDLSDKAVKFFKLEELCGSIVIPYDYDIKDIKGIFSGYDIIEEKI